MARTDPSANSVLIRLLAWKLFGRAGCSPRPWPVIVKLQLPFAVSGQVPNPEEVAFIPSEGAAQPDRGGYHPPDASRNATVLLVPSVTAVTLVRSLYRKIPLYCSATAALV